MTSALPPTRHILVVDDDAGLRDQVMAYLSEHGFAVHGAGDARAMEETLSAAPIDLVILDVRLPGEDGLSICRRLSAAGGPAIIMLSAMDEEVDRVLGLELGADDYLPKSSSPRELMARAKAVLRRWDDAGGRGRKRSVYSFRGFMLDTVRRQLKSPDGATMMLTAGEMSLLRVFLEHPRRILARDQLLELARGGEAEVYDRAIDVQISRLRRKLSSPDNADIIKTYRGAGYLFDAQVARS